MPNLAKFNRDVNMNENYEERMSKALEKVPEARASYFQLKYLKFYILNYLL